MLWGLNRLGFVLLSHRVCAGVLTKHHNPGAIYAIVPKSAFDDIGDLGITSVLDSPLFEGVNVILTGLITPGQPQIAGTPCQFFL